MNHLELSRIFLRFTDRETENKFQRIHQNPKEIRIVFGLSIVFFLAYLVLDYVVFPDFFLDFLFIRAGIFLPVSLMLLGLTFTRFYYAHTTFIITAITLLGAAGVVAMEYIVRDSPYAWLYFFGISQVLLMLFGTGKVPFLASITAGAVIITAALVVDTLFVETDSTVSLIKSIYLITVGAMGVVICGIIQYKTRINFINQVQIEELSVTDSLTGLHNRRFFYSALNDELVQYANRFPSSTHDKYERAEEPPANRQYGILLLDLDYFKKINDGYGHAAGDLVLQEFTRRVQGIIRSTDVFIRWGGEEFLLVLRNTHMDFINKFATMVFKEISGKPFDVGKGVSAAITVSVGVLMIPTHGEEQLTSVEPILGMVDKALYHSKNSGRNRITLVTPSGLYPDAAVEFSVLPEDSNG